MHPKKESVIRDPFLKQGCFAVMVVVGNASREREMHLFSFTTLPCLANNNLLAGPFCLEPSLVAAGFLKGNRGRERDG